jgi:hypothetical protein
MRHLNHQRFHLEAAKGRFALRKPRRIIALNVVVQDKVRAYLHEVEDFTTGEQNEFKDVPENPLGRGRTSACTIPAEDCHAFWSLMIRPLVPLVPSMLPGLSWTI